MSKLETAARRSNRVSVVAVLAAVALLLAATGGHAAKGPPPPALAWSPTSFDYGTVRVGNTAAQQFRLTNTGGSATGALTVLMAGSAAYAITANACTDTALGAGKSCLVTVEYGPRTAGSDTATLTASAKKPATPVAGLSLAGNATSGVSAISAGLVTCAVTIAGGAKCWGDNSNGQLGNGTNTPSNVPVDVTGLTSGVGAIAQYGWHTCALTSAGGVKCWGWNIAGQLGNGTNTDSNVPVDVTGLTSGVGAVATGYEHNCALTSAGAVKCWGSNGNGELGNGTNTDSKVPVNVSGLGSGVVAIGAASFYSCALTNAGGVKCWGLNENGELGNGTNTDSNVPVDVTGLTSGVSAIAVGGAHACALTTAGAVKCWGSNGNGELGNGTNTDSNVPVDVTGLGSGVVAIDAHTQSCAVTSVGAAKCWGYNATGQLGNGTYTDSNVPVAVTGLGSGVAAIAAGYDHTCALTSLGGAKCWGYNGTGQLGNGTYTTSNVPVTVLL